MLIRIFPRELGVSIAIGNLVAVGYFMIPIKSEQ